MPLLSKKRNCRPMPGFLLTLHFANSFRAIRLHPSIISVANLSRGLASKILLTLLSTQRCRAVGVSESPREHPRHGYFIIGPAANSDWPTWEQHGQHHTPNRCLARFGSFWWRLLRPRPLVVAESTPG